MTLVMIIFLEILTWIPVSGTSYAEEVVDHNGLSLNREDTPLNHEPEYCHLRNFERHEIRLGTYSSNSTISRESLPLDASPLATTVSPTNSFSESVHNYSDIKRLHLYKLGAVVFAGMGIGVSPTEKMKSLAQEYSRHIDQNAYCTWYVGTRNSSAASSFNHFPMPGLFTFFPKKMAKTYIEKLGPTFFKNKNSFLSCAKERGYIALGCDHQMHRGPTFFAMVLAFSGCSAENSVKIVNKIWGLNGVFPQVRLEIVKAAYEYGQKNPIPQKQLSELFSFR